MPAEKKRVNYAVLLIVKRPVMTKLKRQIVPMHSITLGIRNESEKLKRGSPKQHFGNTIGWLQGDTNIPALYEDAHCFSTKNTLLFSTKKRKIIMFNIDKICHRKPLMKTLPLADVPQRFRLKEARLQHDKWQTHVL